MYVHLLVLSLDTNEERVRGRRPEAGIILNPHVVYFPFKCDNKCHVYRQYFTWNLISDFNKYRVFNFSRRIIKYSGLLFVCDFWTIVYCNIFLVNLLSLTVFYICCCKVLNADATSALQHSVSWRVCYKILQGHRFKTNCRPMQIKMLLSHALIAHKPDHKGFVG